MDLIHLNMDHEESVFEAHEVMQLSIMNQGELLMASGGSIKPIKYFYHLIPFEWWSNGTWRYAKNELNEVFDISVLILGEQMVYIEHMLVDEPTETLSVYTCPSGDCYGAIKAIQDKVQDQVDTAKNGKLHQGQLWLMLERTIWVEGGYGIRSNTTSFKTLTGYLRKQY